MVRASQLDVALGVLEGLVTQPFLQHWDRHAAQHAVAAVGVPESMGVGPLRVDPHLEGRLFHNLAQAPSRHVQHGPLPVLVVERRQVVQALDQVGRHRDLAALAGLVARGVGPHHDDRRVLVQAQVHVPQRQRLGHPQAGLEHEPEGHASWVAGGGLHQGGGLLRCEVVGNLLDLPRHSIASRGIFATCGPQYATNLAALQG